ncbi:MAG: hypothetical protein CSA20_02060 [Deltaproteobacteria bacterium]|nr:MAG: hypothetical protein CSB23_00090 [Deltaproteobacteria bacterium]PIE73659.1 MAG: hypothetical protein CSA20_02060 [Deltaproteobacteria bacterium]
MAGEKKDEKELARFAREEMDDDRLLHLFEKQKSDLVVRVLKKHEEVEAKNSFIDRILSSLSDLLLVLSEELELLQASREFYQVLGYQQGQCLYLSDIAAAETVRLVTAKLAAGEFRDLETLFLNSKGRPVPVLLRGSTHITASGRIIHMLIASDRREFFAVMDRMREVQDQLIHTGRLVNLGEMAAGIGHELTQPLNTMLLLARNCQKAMSDPIQHSAIINKNLSIIVERINHASSIIRSLRGFASKAQEEVVPCRVNIILLDVLGFMEAQLELSRVKLALELEEGDLFVNAQVVRLEQVLLNLIQNALQAMADIAQPLLTIRMERKTGIDPRSLEQRLWVVVSINDNGCGISPELKEKIFTPFFTTREVGGGMGLGLSIVERIVRGYGGFITLNTTPGKGSSFSVWLPDQNATDCCDGERQERK